MSVEELHLLIDDLTVECQEIQAQLTDTERDDLRWRRRASTALKKKQQVLARILPLYARKTLADGMPRHTLFLQTFMDVARRKLPFTEFRDLLRETKTIMADANRVPWR